MEAGRELDALVAEKVMGWQNVKQDDGDSTFARLSGIDIKSHESHRFTVPEFSTDIAASFDALQKTANDLQCGWEIEKHESDGALYVTIKGQSEGEYWENKIKAAKHSDIPWGICLAALRAKGVEV